jgi:molecular chaperone GrpE
MAIFEGPAPAGDQLNAPVSGVSQASAAASQGLPEMPPLTPERSRQELEKLAGIIKANETLHFLEPRVHRCLQDGSADLTLLLSFYRLISQALSEELEGQKEKLQASQSALAQASKSSAQAQLQAAMEEASMAVQMVQRGESTSAPSGGAPSTGGPPASDEVLAKLEMAEKQSERLLQDMQNMRNRAKIDVDVKVFKELEKFCGSLLPALDAFHQAMPTLQTTSDIGSVVTGVTMIYEQLRDSLEKAGLRRMKVVGEKFDPRYHEAIGEVPTNDVPDDHCYDELQPGYMLGERMLRAAMVRIARNDSPAPAPQAAPPAAPPPPQAEAPAAAAPSAVAPPPAPAAETVASPPPAVAADPATSGDPTPSQSAQ